MLHSSHTHAKRKTRLYKDTALAAEMEQLLGDTMWRNDIVIKAMKASISKQRAVITHPKNGRR
jgi:hypothetical protein